MIKILQITLLSLGPLWAFGQDSLLVITHVEQAIALAVDHNAALKSVRSEREKAIHLQGTALDIGKTGIYHSYDANNLAPNDRALRVFGIRQTLPFPTTFSHRDRLLKVQAEKAMFQYELRQWQLKKEVSQAYYEWLFTSNKLRHYQYLDSIFYRFSVAAQQRYQVGETTYLEDITARNHYQQHHLQLLQTKEELKMAFEKIIGLLQADRSIQLVHTPLEKINWTQSSSLTPLHHILGAEVNEMEAEWKVSRGEFLPGISLEYFRGFGIGEGRQNFNGYSVGLEIPLWIKPYHKYQQAMKVEVDRATHLLQDYEKRRTARQAELEARLEKYAASLQYFETEGLPSAQEIQQVASESYYAGEVDYMDYTKSLEIAARTYIQYLQDLNQYNQTFITLFYLADPNY